MKRFLVLIGIYIIFVSTTAYAQYSDYKRTDGRALANTLAETAKIRKGNDEFGERVQRDPYVELTKPDFNQRNEYFLDKNSQAYVKMRLQELEKQLYEKTRKEVLSERRAKLEVGAAATDKFYNEADDLRNQSIESLESADIEREVQRRMDSEVVLKHFGKDFFDSGKIDRASLFEGLAPSDYKLGAGDEVKIIIWSDIGDQTIYDMQINPEGQIYVPMLGVIQVTGMTVKRLEEVVVGRLSEKFKHFKGQATLTKVRTIQVFVTGEVEQPGAMIVSGLSTAFSVLYQSGGPTRRGSMRNISVIGQNGKEKKIDLYDYFLTGDRRQDVSIANGDTIFVPMARKRIIAGGLIARPAVYEITEETTLAKVIEMAGGILPNAYSGRVSITRWNGTEPRLAFDVELNDRQALEAFVMKSGDEIKIDQAIELVGNNVKIEGPVNRPGKYAIGKSLTVKELIERAGGIIKEEANMIRGQIYRKLESGKQQILGFNLTFAMAGDKAHNHVLLPFDIVRIFAEEEVKSDVLRISIDGAIRRPGRYIYRTGMTLVDLVVKARGLTVDADGIAEIARIGEKNEVNIIRVNIKNALNNAKSADNIELKALDRISLPSNMEKRIEADVVVLKGQVKRPGPYALKYRGEKLSSLIERAGGLTSMAFAEGCVFMRKAEHITSQNQIETAQAMQNDLYRQATLDLRADLLRAGAKIDGELRSSVGMKTVTAQVFESSSVESGELAQDLTKAQSSVFSEIEMKSKEFGNKMVRIPVPLRDVAEKRAEDFEDIALLDGDQITIPVIPHTISIVGAVMNPTTILYNTRNTSAGYYIKKAGGFTNASDHRRSLVVRAGGEVLRMRDVRKIERGDIILVPPKAKVVKPNTMKEISNIAGILGNLAVTYKVINDN